MSDALTPLRHAYGVEPAGPVPATGERGHAELQLMRQMRAVLDEVPRPSPSNAAVDATLAHAEAAAASDPLAAVRHVYDRADAPSVPAEVAFLRTTAEAVDRAVRLGAERPAPSVIEAVLARAAEASALPAEPALPAEGLVEGIVLAQTLGALDRLRAERPSTSAVARVRAYAEAASAPDALAAVRHLYADGPALSGSVEVAVLRQSSEAVDRALRARPQPRPHAEAVAAVLARAAEASSLPSEAALVGEGPVEAVVLAQSLAALNRLPVERPTPASVEPVLARAASSTSRPTRRSSDRAPSRPARRPRTGVWAGVGGLLMAVVVAVVALPSVPSTSGPLPEAVTGIAPVVADAEAASEPSGALAESEPAAAAPAAGPTLVALGGPPVPVTERERPVQTGAVAEAPSTGDVPPARRSPPPAWDAGDDVRALSIRLQELNRGAQGLDWDTPVETLEAPSLEDRSSPTPGLLQVREGALPRPAVPVPTDSTRDQR